MPRLPPLTELRAFEAAARHLSFKAAADEMGVTPTAISHQIKLLEAFCGHALFRRRPRPLTLTEAGATLYPGVRDGFQRFTAALASLASVAARGPLRVTATNAFAARCIVPRLPSWRQAHPEVSLSIIGTDAVLDLKDGAADVAIRYARRPPAGYANIELVRDTFLVVASPRLVGKAPRTLPPSALADYPLIECTWPVGTTSPPTWNTWEQLARKRYRAVPRLSDAAHLSFVEELHGIEAAIAGQGIAICSDVLVAPELASGQLMRVSPLRLTGYGFFLAYQPDHTRVVQIRAFADWLLVAMAQPDTNCS